MYCIYYLYKAKLIDFFSQRQVNWMVEQFFLLEEEYGKGNFLVSKWRRYKLYNGSKAGTFSGDYCQEFAKGMIIRCGDDWTITTGDTFSYKKIRRLMFIGATNHHESGMIMHFLEELDGQLVGKLRHRWILLANVLIKNVNVSSILKHDVNVIL